MTKIIRTNWFPIGFALIIAYGLARKYTTLFQSTKSRDNISRQTEKFTENKSNVVEMGIGSDVQSTMPPIEDAQALAFLKRFSHVAKGEYQKFGIPASVVLSAAYVNSHAGQRDLAKKANNLFAMSCTSEWAGATVSANGHCYRRYDRPWDSFRDFSKYLSQRDWYAQMRTEAGKDWHKWLAALQTKQVGIAGAYADMDRVIERYRLFELDE